MVAVRVNYFFVGQVVAGFYTKDVFTYELIRSAPRLCMKIDALDCTESFCAKSNDDGSVPDTTSSFHWGN